MEERYKVCLACTSTPVSGCEDMSLEEALDLQLLIPFNPFYLRKMKPLNVYEHHFKQSKYKLYI